MYIISISYNSIVRTKESEAWEHCDITTKTGQATQAVRMGFLHDKVNP